MTWKRVKIILCAIFLIVWVLFLCWLSGPVMQWLEPIKAMDEDYQAAFNISPYQECLAALYDEHEEVLAEKGYDPFTHPAPEDVEIEVYNTLAEKHNCQRFAVAAAANRSEDDP